MGLEQKMLSLRPSCKGASGEKSFPLNSNRSAPIVGGTSHLRGQRIEFPGEGKRCRTIAF